MKALRETELRAIELLGLRANDPRRAELESDPLVQFVAQRRRSQRPLPRHQALEHRPRRQHDAGSRQPHGRLRHHRGLPRLPRFKWMDAQLEATYEGPEAVQRRQLTVTMTTDVFLADSARGHRRCAASPPLAPAPAHAPSPPPCRCGSGPSTTSRAPSFPRGNVHGIFGRFGDAKLPGELLRFVQPVLRQKSSHVACCAARCDNAGGNKQFQRRGKLQLGGSGWEGGCHVDTTSKSG